MVKFPSIDKNTYALLMAGAEIMIEIMGKNEVGHVLSITCHNSTFDFPSFYVVITKIDGEFMQIKQATRANYTLDDVPADSADIRLLLRYIMGSDLNIDQLIPEIAKRFEVKRK